MCLNNKGWTLHLLMCMRMPGSLGHILLETAPPHPNGTVPSPLSLLSDCYIITSYSSAQRLLPSCVFIS